MREGSALLRGQDKDRTLIGLQNQANIKPENIKLENIKPENIKPEDIKPDISEATVKIQLSGPGNVMPDNLEDIVKIKLSNRSKTIGKPESPKTETPSEKREKTEEEKKSNEEIQAEIAEASTCLLCGGINPPNSYQKLHPQCPHKICDACLKKLIKLHHQKNGHKRHIKCPYDFKEILTTVITKVDPTGNSYGITDMNRNDFSSFFTPHRHWRDHAFASTISTLRFRYLDPFDDILSREDEEKEMECPHCLTKTKRNNEGLSSRHLSRCMNCQCCFYFCCSVKISPVHAHGKHYHRPGCRNYSPSDLGLGGFKNNCTECTRERRQCERPERLNVAISPHIEGYHRRQEPQWSPADLESSDDIEDYM